MEQPLLVLVLVLEKAISHQPSAISQSPGLVLVLVLETYHNDTTAPRRFPWHGRPARVRNPDGHGLPARAAPFLFTAGTAVLRFNHGKDARATFRVRV
jgi:hypothetical protein